MVSSFLLQNVPRRDTRVFEVREAFKRTLLVGFRAYISAYITTTKNAPPATDAGPLINALIHTAVRLENRPRDLQPRSVFRSVRTVDANRQESRAF